MRFHQPTAFLTSLVCLLSIGLAGACDGGSGTCQSLACGFDPTTDPAPNPSSGGAGTGGQPSGTAGSGAAPTCVATSIPWLREGNFWQVSWSEIDFQVGLFESTGSAGVGSYSMTLGAPLAIHGVDMFPIAISGDTEKYAPLWKYVGTDGCGNVVASNGEAPRPIYSTRSPSWAGSGFWTDFAGIGGVTVNRSARIIPSQYTEQIPRFKGLLTAVGVSDSAQGPGGSGCEYFAGYGTICGSDAPGMRTSTMHSEYWDVDAGPVAWHSSSDYDSGGSPSTERHREQRLEVWFFGDAAKGPLHFEREPDSYVRPTHLEIPDGVKSHVFAMAAEVNKQDLPGGAQPGVSAVVSDAKYAQIKSWYKFSQTEGQRVAEQIQDWFEFDIVNPAERVELYLLWNDESVDLELHWFAAPSNSTFGFLYMGQDYLQTQNAFPEFKRKKGIPNPTVAGKYLLGVRRTAPPQFASQYGIMVLK